MQTVLQHKQRKSGHYLRRRMSEVITKVSRRLLDNKRSLSTGK